MSAGKSVGKVSQADATTAFARIGLMSFGGPAAQIAVMHRVLVEEKGWLSETQFLHALNFCMLLPGPEAMQLATYAGWRLGGIRGGLIAGLLFIVPGLLMMLALSAIYVAYGDVPVLAGIFYGLKAAVIGVVLQALLKVSGRALGNGFMICVAIAAFVAIFFLHVPFPIIVGLAALLGFALWQLAPQLLPSAVLAPVDQQVSALVTGTDALRQTVRAIVLWGGLWLGAMALLMGLSGSNFLIDAALFFSQTAIVTFGGAYAVLAYVGQQVVTSFGWIGADDMLKGLGLAETTMGPLVLVLVFVGFVGGANISGGLVGGLTGGLVAAFFTFVPCFLWIFAGAPHLERLRAVRWLTASLAVVTAAVVGVIANLAVWFSIAVLFGEPDYGQWRTLYYPLIDTAQIDYLAIIIAALSAIALLRFKMDMMIVLAGAAIAGLAMQNLF